MPQVINLGNSPAADADNQLLVWKADPPNANVSVKRNVSVEVPIMTASQGGITPTPPNDATKFLDGTGHYTVPSNPVVTSTVKGLVPNPPNDATKFLDGTGVFSTPGGGGGGSSAGSLVGYRRTNRMVCKQKASGGTLTEIGDVINVLGSEFNPWEYPNTTRGQSTSYDNGSSDTVCGWQGNTSLNYLLGNNLHMFADAYLGDITDILFIAGLFSSSSLGGTTVPNFYNTAYIRFDVTAGDTVFHTITSDGFGSQTVTATSVTPVALQSYRFLVVIDDTTPNVKFYINDVLVATHTTHLPGTSQRVIWQVSAAWHSVPGSPTIGISEVVVQSDK